MENSGVSDKETIALVIKSPNQFHDDQLIDGVRTDWTVKDLKSHLSEVYPNNPVRLSLLSSPTFRFTGPSAFLRRLKVRSTLCNFAHTDRLMTSKYRESNTKAWILKRSRGISISAIDRSTQR